MGIEKFKKYYDLEEYLFSEVKRSFKEDRYIDCFDFFCIIIWKSNRSKSKIAEGLKDKYGGKIKDIIPEFTKKIYQEETLEGKLRLLLSVNGIGLAIASAVLTVLYPEGFTIYDFRVCEHEKLKKFKNIGDISNKDKKIKKYFEFRDAVKNIPLKNKSLRFKDKCLWGKSFHDELKDDVKKWVS